MSVRLNEDLTFTFQALLLGQALNLIATNLAAVNFLGGQSNTFQYNYQQNAKRLSDFHQYFQRLISILLGHFRTIPFRMKRNCKPFLFQAHKNQNWDERQSLDLSILDFHLCG